MDEVEQMLTGEAEAAAVEPGAMPPGDALGRAIRASAELDPIETRLVMQRVRAALTVAAEPEDPVRIGRHVIVRKIAEGGFGVVYEAFDPELHRQLAVKVLRTDGGRRVGSQGTSLLEEARALARVSHPNVVAVFDVGVLANQGDGTDLVYLAMEMVGGETLRDWLERERPPWREVAKRFRAAGEGLAAAHDAGVVHRDFKPANVLIGSDGRVRVADFGLAITARRPGGAVGGSERSSGDPARHESGTPAYMAPEQHRGEPCDVRSDVYSFCLSLYQGLYGELPFHGKSSRELQEVKEAPLSLPSGRGVPGWLRQLIVRGLQPNPSDRTASLREILDELDRRLGSHRRTWAALGVVAAVAVGLGHAIAPEPLPALEADACRLEAEEATEDVWGSGMAAVARGAFEQTELTYADTAWQTTAKGLDVYLARWQARRQDLCEARPFLERNAPQLYEHRRGCLDDRLKQVEALAEQLEAADREVVQHSVQAVYALEDPEGCAGEAIADSPPPSMGESERQHRDEARVDLAQAKTLQALGKYDELPPLIEALTLELEKVENVSLRAEIEIGIGYALEAIGDDTGAERMYRSGARNAEIAGMMLLTAHGKGRLIRVVASSVGRSEEGLVWASNTEAAIAAARATGADTRRLEGLYQESLGSIHFSRGEYDEAREAFTKVLALREELDGPGHLMTITVLNNLASVHYAKGEFEAAERLFRRVYEHHARDLGLDHPTTSTILANLGAVTQVLGRYQEARSIAERVLQSRLRVQGPDGLLTAYAHLNLGLVSTRLGDLAVAREHHERALDIVRSAISHGHEHPQFGDFAAGLAYVLQRQGDLEGAERLHREALAHIEKNLGEDHPSMVLVYANLGEGLRRLGRFAEAEASHRAALRILEPIEPAHPGSVSSWTGLALVLVEVGRAAEALPYLERARAIALGPPPTFDKLAMIDMVLGMARWELDDDRVAARELVVRAGKVFSADPGLEVEARNARAWLSKHPADRPPSG